MLKISVIIMLFLVPAAFAQEFNMSKEGRNALDSIKTAELDIEEVLEAGYRIQKMNDTLNTAKQLYDAQVALEKQGGQSDYGTIQEMTTDISDTKEKAFDTGDEIAALKSYISDLKNTGLSFTYAEQLSDQASAEFMNERYEEASKLVEQSYDSIYKVQSESTTANAVYKAATETMTDFFKKAWHILLAAGVVIAITLFFMQNRIVVYKLKGKIKHLELERKILEDLTKKTQYEYFEKKTLPEETYSIRIKKFGELIRDINRQIPVLKERIETKKSGKKAKKNAELEQRLEERVQKELKKPDRKKSGFSLFRKRIGAAENVGEKKVRNPVKKSRQPAARKQKALKQEKKFDAEKVHKIMTRILHGKKS